MAFKRYVHKKGKKHGPYYYKNVRDHTGKVRSVYLGKVSSRGKKPLEVAIVFLVVLLMIISTLFFIQNRNLVKESAEENTVPFEVDQVLIKVLVKEGEYVEKELRVMNVGDRDVSITADASWVSHLANILDKEFTIKPGQTKIVRINFTSFDRNEGIEQAPGVYIGKVIAKSESYQKEIPLIVEIESKNVLFDMNLNPVARDRSVVQGDSTTFEIRVFNLQSIESFNVGMDFFVKDINGNTIVSEKESVVVQTQASFFKTLKIPQNLKPGDYVFVAQASLGKSVGTSSYLFEVESAAAKEGRFNRLLGFCRDDPLCWTLSIIVLLLIFGIGAYAYFFVGVLIYEKLFGAGFSRKKKEDEREGQAEEEEEPEIKKEERAEEKTKKGGASGKCTFLIEKGYNALNKGNIWKADRIYAKIMSIYSVLDNESKAEIFKDVNSFYKSLLLKRSQIKTGEIEKKKKLEQERQQKEEQKKKWLDERINLRQAEAKRRKEQIRKDWQNAKKRWYQILHGLGLVKTEEEKELEKKKIEGKKSRYLEREKQEQGRQKLKELELRKKEENAIRLQEEKRKEEELARKKKEEEMEHIGEERKKAFEEKRKQQELETKRREAEAREKEEGKKRLEEEKAKQYEMRRKQKELEKKKQEEERNRKLEDIKELEDIINAKDSRISKLREKISAEYAGIKSIENDSSNLQKDVDSLRNEKGMLFKVYNDSLEGREELSKERENKIAEWKQIYEAKLEERLQLAKELKQQHDNEVRELENNFKGLSAKEMAEQEKWKKLEIKAKYKLEEQERGRELREQIKGLLEEKKGIEEGFRSRKIGASKGVSGKDVIDKQKGINDHIIEHEKELNELKKKTESKERLIEKYKAEIEKLEEERGREKITFLQKKRELGGINQLYSIFHIAERIKQPIKESLKSKEKAPDKKDAKEEKKKQKGIFRLFEKEEPKEIDEQQVKELEEMEKKQEIELQKSLEQLEEFKQESAKKDETAQEKKAGFLSSIFKAATKEEEEKKTEILAKRKDKSWRFIKCHKLLLKGEEELINNNAKSAKKYYLKAREIYLKLEYNEKKYIYDELNELYEKLTKPN